MLSHTRAACSPPSGIGTDDHFSECITCQSSFVNYSPFFIMGTHIPIRNYHFRMRTFCKRKSTEWINSVNIVMFVFFLSFISKYLLALFVTDLFIKSIT